MNYQEIAWCTMTFLEKVSESRDLTKEERLLQAQAVITLKESLRHNELHIGDMIRKQLEDEEVI